MITRAMVAAGGMIDQIKINRLSREELGGRQIWFKQRRRGSRFIIAAANWFFRLTGNPVTILAERSEWMEWERTCHSLLHGGQFAVVVDGRGAWGVEEFPGQSLSDYLRAGTATLSMAAAAARELRRAHLVSCSHYPDGWSHGDPHTGNFVYDPIEDRARLMDFEVQHHPGLSAQRRHADDLLVCLQDTLGRMPLDRWLDWARTFVQSYGHPEVTGHLVERLRAPRGVARLWWAVRTTYMTPRELDLRLAALRSVLVS
jgi:hypothetical protein